jgi:hypothetical protein
MTFLAPLFLLGATAIALPVIFHLIRRTSREKQVFSSLMFLAPTPPRVTRRSRLENILLLLLRCAIIALLALAFARPLFRQPVAAVSREARRAVLLIDTSASMRREGVWNDALAKAGDVVKQFTAVDQLAVMTFDRQTRTLVSFAEWIAAADRAALAVQRLKSAAAGWSATHLGAALLAAGEALDQDRAATGPREIIVVSDLQDGARLDGLQGFAWPKNTRVTVHAIKARTGANAGLQIVPEPPNASGDAATVKLRVSNNGDAKREQFQVRWQNGTNTVTVYVPPGQSRTADLPKPPSSARAVLTGDECDFDNSAYAVPPRREEIEILYLGAAAATDPQAQLFYLQRAFPETARQSIVVTQWNAAVALATNSRAGLIVIDGPLPEARANEVRDAVRAGKSALVPVTTPAVADLLSGLTGQRITAVDAARSGSSASSGYAMLAEIDFTHPLLVPFADVRFSDFTKIHFWKHRQLAFDATPAARVIARFDNRDPALVQFNVGRGSIFVLASGWQPGDSQLALSSKFVPLLYSMLELAGTTRPQTPAYAVGDAVDLSAVTARPVNLRLPDGTTRALAANETRFVPESPGVHSVLVEPPVEFAVNLAPEESRTVPMEVDELRRLGVPLNSPTPAVAARGTGRTAHTQAAELEARQKLWRWLIAVTLVVLMAETWIAARASKASVAPTEATP